MRAGRLSERLMIQANTPVARVVTSLTRSGTVATATTNRPHEYATGDYVTITGAAPSGYTGKVKITVTGAATFTYAVVGSLTTPATGTIAAVYVNDAQGGRAVRWWTVDTVWAEMIPMRSMERLQAAAVQALVDYRFRIRARADVTATMRVLWTPRGAAQKTLVLTGPPLFEDGRESMLLETSERAA